jgi:heptosyltransferase-2
MNKVNTAIFDAGCENSVRHFASLTSYCAVMLSSDSLAMHVALAMGCRVVVLFGPTSNTEIEIFNRGEKIIPELDCLSCYKRDCDKKPNCMDSISVSTVKLAIKRQLDAAERS